jgi:hypothetical protein
VGEAAAIGVTAIVNGNYARLPAIGTAAHSHTTGELITLAQLPVLLRETALVVMSINKTCIAAT